MTYAVNYNCLSYKKIYQSGQEKGKNLYANFRVRHETETQKKQAAAAETEAANQYLAGLLHNWHYNFN